MTTDMTHGSPTKILWRFCLPMLISIVFQQLYNIVDSVVAGQFIGENALAAVGASYPITMIFMAVAGGCNIGCSVVTSQLFGAKNMGGMKTAISTSLISVSITSILLTVLGFIFCIPLLTLLGTPANIFDGSALYLNIYIGGLFFLFLYNICTGIFTALGDSKTPLYLLIVSSLGNIFMDLLFVIVFHMGIAGVAWATFLCQGIAAILAFIVLIKRFHKIETECHYQKFSTYMLGRISMIAIPSILQQSFVSVGNLFVQGLINSFGSNVIAGYSAAIKLNTFALTGFATMANGVSTFTAQNLGAGQINRVKHGFRSGCLMAISIVIPFFIAFTFFGTQFMHLFVGNHGTKRVIDVGITFLRIVSPFYFVIMLKLIADAVLRGAGSMRAFMVATFADLILRVVLSFVLSSYMGEIGIWLSWPVGWTIGTILSLIFYFSGTWKKINVLHAD